MVRNLHWNRNRDWYLDLFLTNMSDLLLTLIFVKFLLNSFMEMLTSLLVPGGAFPLRNFSLCWLALLVYLLLEQNFKHKTNRRIQVRKLATIHKYV